MPSRPSLSASERELFSQLRKLLHEPSPILRGNLVEMKRKCGKKSCHCATDPDSRHRSLYLGLKQGGKQRMVYIPADWEERVREWTERHSRVRELVEEISVKSLKRLEERKE